MIEFRFNPVKAIEGIEFLMNLDYRSLEIPVLLRTVYEADRYVLNNHGRPIFGCRYVRGRTTPISLEISRMIAGDQETVSGSGRHEFPWVLSESRDLLFRRSPRSDSRRYRNLAEVDRTALDRELSISRMMMREDRFAERPRLSPLLAEWQGGAWRTADPHPYEEMIRADHKNRAEIIEELQIFGPRLVI